MCLVYNLTHVLDFSGPIAWVKPEVFTTRLSSSGDAIFQNDTGVVAHGTCRIKMGYDVDASLHTSSFMII